MAKKRAEDAPPSLLWKDTFSDLMNLLLCFFVLLFSMSTVDADKFQELAASLASAFSVLPSGGSTIKSDGILVGSGASQLNELSDYYNNMGMNSEGDVELDKESNTVDVAYEKVQEEGLEQSEKMADTIQAALDMSNVDSSQVEITTTSQYVMLSLSSGILFDSGKADLKAEAISVVDKVADAVKIYDDNTISIEGHTDNVPIRYSAKYENNEVLSVYRALAVTDQLRKNKNLNPKYIKFAGRGDYIPVADNSTAEGRAQNRRVEIKIYNSFNSNVKENN